MYPVFAPFRLNLNLVVEVCLTDLCILQGTKGTIPTLKCLSNRDLADVRNTEQFLPLSRKFPTPRRESCLKTWLSLGIFSLLLITIPLP